jgi:hypothetical protein
MAARTMVTMCIWSASSLRSRRSTVSGIGLSPERAVEDGDGLENVTSPRIFSGRVRVKSGNESCENRITFKSRGTLGLLTWTRRSRRIEQRRKRYV